MSDHTEKPRLYNRVKLLRQDQGISREDFAADLGISLTKLGHLERENYDPGLLLAWKIADYFGAELETLFSPEPMPPRSEALRPCSSQQPQGEPDGEAPRHDEESS